MMTGNTDDDEAKLVIQTTSDLAEQLGVDEIVVFVGEFIADLEKQMAEVVSSFKQQSLEECQRLAHSLRGTCAIFALNEVIDISGNIEDQAAKGAVDDIAKSIDRLTASEARAKSMLQQALDHLNSQS